MKKVLYIFLGLSLMFDLIVLNVSCSFLYVDIPFFFVNLYVQLLL